MNRVLVTPALKRHPAHQDLTDEQPLTFRTIEHATELVIGYFYAFRDTGGRVVIEWPIEEERPNP